MPPRPEGSNRRKPEVTPPTTPRQNSRAPMKRPVEPNSEPDSDSDHSIQKSFKSKTLSHSEDSEADSGQHSDIEYLDEHEQYTPAGLNLEDLNNPDRQDFEQHSETESTQEEGWVPLKKKVLFKPVKRAVLSTDELCAGCGIKLSTGWFKAPNYCHYSNKYFCTNCHQNYKFMIPARIFFHWDFKYYPICNYYREFLKDMYAEPLYDITVINPAIYKQIPALGKIRIVRQQLRYMKDFILTCRDKQKLIALCSTRFYLVDTEMYSLSDLVDVQKEELFRFLRNLAEQWMKHISDCEICRSKGSICEFCNKKEVIFPFNLKTTVQCPKCKSSAHRGCYSSQTCPKCLRLQTRKKLPLPPRKRNTSVPTTRPSGRGSEKL